jgi:hypothetical protein
MSLMRKRVLLKSPVRENRTPGSVRGASSNRCLYRDRQLSRSPLGTAKINKANINGK